MALHVRTANTLTGTSCRFHSECNGERETSARILFSYWLSRPSRVEGAPVIEELVLFMDDPQPDSPHLDRCGMLFKRWYRLSRRTAVRLARSNTGSSPLSNP